MLGDSFHDRQAWERLPTSQQAQIGELTRQVPVWHWLVGNHDTTLPAALPGVQGTTLQIGPLHFAHAPTSSLRYTPLTLLEVARG